jgi:uncharacterized protein YaiL (DUF2058 family)
MSMSLRDQLLQAGLVSQKQVKEAERQEQRQKQQQKHQQRPKHQHPPSVASPAAAAPVRKAQSAKVARDQELNRRQQEKAQRKALQAQIKQLIDQNRLPPVEGDEFYNFVDGDKVRRIGINAAVRGTLERGEVVIVRNQAGYAFVPAAIAARIRERDERAVIALRVAAESPPVDEAYKEFAVPDDLMW